MKSSEKLIKVVPLRMENIFPGDLTIRGVRTDDLISRVTATAFSNSKENR